MQGLSYCAHEVYAHDRDLFTRCMFVPAQEREPLLCVYALVVELEKIRSIVSEEMIGHIRYAWWQEAVEAIYAGNKPHGQPVLESLAPLISSGRLPATVLMPLLEKYRANFPQLPPDKDELIKNISLALINSPEGWLKADRIITTHRRRYGRRLHFWLVVKLLLLK